MGQHDPRARRRRAGGPAMKHEGSGILSTLGSVSRCRSLLKAGLVERFRVFVFPVITGASDSERIYDGYPDVALDMASTRTFDGRIQRLEGVPRVLAGPPDVNNAPLKSGNMNTL